jgi:radical SAM-linked protein
MARVRPGEAANPAPPTVVRVRIRFAKRGRLRFLSHRDVARSFERAIRRAGVPVAHSHGFNPHPRLSWVGAAPTGAASEAEYLEIGLAAACDPAAVQAALDAALPPGLDIVEVVVAPPGALADRLTGSRWRADLVGVSADDQQAAVRQFLAEPEVLVSRMTKNGVREFDARGAVVSLEAVDRGLTMTLAHGVPLVRPDPC